MKRRQLGAISTHYNWTKMSKVLQINALDEVKMNFSTLGIRTSMRDYQVAYYLNKDFQLNFKCRPEPEEKWESETTWLYNVYDGIDQNLDKIVLINLHNFGAINPPDSGFGLFESVTQKHLLPSVKLWDYLLVVENVEFAFELEFELKRHPKIATAQYFEANKKLTQRETHLLYEIRNG